MPVSSGATGVIPSLEKKLGEMVGDQECLRANMCGIFRPGQSDVGLRNASCIYQKKYTWLDIVAGEYPGLNYCRHRSIGKTFFSGGI